MKKLLITILGIFIITSCSEDNQTQNEERLKTDSVEFKPIHISDYILGDWIADYAQDDIDGYRWEILKFHESGIMYFSNYSESKNTSHDYVNGEYYIDGNVIKTNCQLGWTDLYKTYNANLRVNYINEYTLKTDIIVDGQIVGKNTYLKLLGIIEAEHGDTLPDYSKLVGGRKILGYKSHNDYIASVNEVNGTITCKWAGTTFVDIITETGTATLLVRVKDLLNYDFENYIGTTLENIANAFGYLYTSESNVHVYNYNDSYYPELQRESGIWKTMRVRMKLGKVDAISLYAKDDMNMTSNQVVEFLTKHYTLYHKSTKEKNISGIDESTLEKQMNENIMAFYIGQSRKDAKVGVVWDKNAKVLRYINLDSYSQVDYGHLIRNTSDELKSKIGGTIFSYNTGLVTIYYVNLTYVSKLRIDFRNNNSRRLTNTAQDIIVYLYDDVEEKVIRNELDSLYNFSYEFRDIVEYTTEDKKTRIYYDIDKNFIRYLNLGIELDYLGILPDYTECVLHNVDVVKDYFGAPTETTTDQIIFKSHWFFGVFWHYDIKGNDYIRRIALNNSGGANYTNVIVYLKNNINPSEISNFLSSLYTYKENSSYPDSGIFVYSTKIQYNDVWIEYDSTNGVIYYYRK